ncbi:MAG: NADH dehydrogenase [Candidatus Hinthialibacteria bacterium]|jgi:NADH-quinone oxidoreductase subunit J|nr:NADH-quinone oxidoreductase subunit J [bacterium]MBK7494547.1 NADH-quinone oxidoreductase subunit J [Candidatus Omnitrophota bacterium]MBV6483387.1 NADH-quinone oxidoreductase subunit J [bacterium]MCC6732861.1 NADH-quinone oxidoreductase subunit J [Candidatus Omnitrophota bacterium]
MNTAFYIASAVAVFATAKVVTHTNPVHALLYFIVSLLAVALIFFCLGAQLAALFEVIIYAGAIMVLFVFMIMMLNLGTDTALREAQLFSPGIWIGPSVLSGLLLLELAVLFIQGEPQSASNAAMVSPKDVALSLFNTYFLGVELASMLLLAALVGGFHLGKRDQAEELPGEVK